MSQIDHVLMLKEMIRLKEAEHKAEEREVIQCFHETYESLKPINIIKNTVAQAFKAPELSGNLMNIAMGLASGFLTRKFVVGSSSNPFTKVAGAVLEMVVASKVTQNADEIKSIAAIIIRKIIQQFRQTEPVE
ncbi:MAG: hypothetical protein RL007_2818 [Bacteroidota bacterium]